jgi:general secretion pathway protein A
MYEQFYGFRDKPFSLTPNPRFIFYSQQYHQAEAQLIYGINNREGFMVVTGQPGTGKTTLCRNLIEKLDREKSQTAFIFNPFLNGIEMLAALLTEFGIIVPPGATRKELLDRLNHFLLAQLKVGKRCVAIFDEAQHLAPEFLEQIRVLSNLETEQEKLIQIILVGQPELLDKIRTPKMAQLDQRVSIRSTLNDLSEDEADRYIHHRLNVAGTHGQVRFTPRAVKAIFRASHGVPRLINLICDRTLLAGYAAQTRDIQPVHVMKAIAALRGEDAEVHTNTSPRRPVVGDRTASTAAFAFLGFVAIAATGAALWPRWRSTGPDDQLYAQTVYASSASDAERDLTDFISRYPNSQHYSEAVLRLARLQLSRGDRTAAIQNLSQLAEQVPSGIHHASALVLAAQAHIDNGDTTAACLGISPGLSADVRADSALSRQFATVSSLCAGRPPLSVDSIRRLDSTAVLTMKKPMTPAVNADPSTLRSKPTTASPASAKP